MRLGTADLEGIHFDGGIERRVKEIRYHPRYRPGRVYFDVGVATANKLITFTEYVRPVCLPYLPVDFEDSLKDKFVTLAGWGYTIQARSGAEPSVELTSNLKLRSLKVISVLSYDRFEYDCIIFMYTQKSEHNYTLADRTFRFKAGTNAMISFQPIVLMRQG